MCVRACCSPRDKFGENDERVSRASFFVRASERFARPIVSRIHRRTLRPTPRISAFTTRVSPSPRYSRFDLYYISETNSSMRAFLSKFIMAYLSRIEMHRAIPEENCGAVVSKTLGSINISRRLYFNIAFTMVRRSFEITEITVHVIRE